MRVKVTRDKNENKADDRVEIKIGGKTFLLRERSGDLYLEKLGYITVDICFFKCDEVSTILKIQ